MRTSIHLAMIVTGVVCATTGCTDDAEDPCELTYAALSFLRIDSAEHPSPMLPGSAIEIVGEGFILERGCVTSQILLAPSGGAEVPLEAEFLSPNDARAVVTEEVMGRLGTTGSFSGNVVVRFTAVTSNRVFDAVFPVNFLFSQTLTPSVSAVQHESALYLNDGLVLIGDGFIGGGEGVTEVVVDGTYTIRESGASETVAGVRLPGELDDPLDRRQLRFYWSPLASGLEPGSFRGTFTPENVHGEARVPARGNTVSAMFDQEATVFFDVEPDVVSLGQTLRFVGRGFIGRPGLDEGVSSILLQGQFTPHRGETQDDFELELIGRFIDGGVMGYDLATDVGSLVSADFGVARGVFEGRALPILFSGMDEYYSTPVGLTLTLGPVRQICWVRFLPGFSESLEHYGLGAVEDEIRRRVLERMQEIYQPPDRPSEWINVEFRTEPPEDFFEGGYAILDLGGPDPNGYGLLGYDSAPNKDVGNLRLHDHIGGDNALGGIDACCAYGGVFIDTYLAFSAHPPFPSAPAAPDPDPRFDAIFDPVRNREVVAGEFPSGASAERLAQIEQAIHALSSLIADTAAHEFGHSLGLAQPWGSREEYHNAFAGDGCIMDSGGARPFEERSRTEGNLGSHFCGDALYYLQGLHPME